MNYHKWTDEEVEFLRRNYPYYPNKRLVEMLYFNFGIKTNPRNVRNVRKKYNLSHKKIKNAGSFKKGQEPWNKGKKIPEEIKKKSSKTWFKKGQTPQNHKPVGSIRLSVGGYKEIKVAEPNKWVLYHRYLWEKHRKRKLGKNEVILFADGNKTNFNIENLILINRNQLAFLNREGLIKENPEITKAGINLAKMMEVVYEKERQKK